MRAVWSAASCQSGTNATRAGSANRSLTSAPGDAGLRVLARAVHVEHDRLVGVLLEDLGELLGEQSACGCTVCGWCTAMMRPGADDGARRRERGGDLGRVVRVVVVHAHAADRAVQLEAALRCRANARDAGEGCRGVEAEPDEHGERAGGVDGVVAAGDAERRAVRRRPRRSIANDTGPSVSTECTRTWHPRPRRSVTIRSCERRAATRARAGVVGGDDDELARPVGEVDEGLLERLERAVVVEVVGVDVGDERDRGVVEQERPVRLVGLDDEELALTGCRADAERPR